MLKILRYNLHLKTGTSVALGAKEGAYHKYLYFKLRNWRVAVNSVECSESLRPSSSIKVNSVFVRIANTFQTK